MSSRAHDSATEDSIQASVDALRQAVYEHYGLHGRDLPWRKTHDPYHIFVSEIMLQQTQVDRVTPKYESFIARFPTFSALAEASTVELLAEWRGLGYNRRALAMQRAARSVVENHGGTLHTAPLLCMLAQPLCMGEDTLP